MSPDQPPTQFGAGPMATAMQTDGLTFLRNVISQRYPASPFAKTSDIWMMISILLDRAIGCAVQSTLMPGQGFATVDMTVSFVRAVLPTSGKLTCDGKIIHSGGRNATAEGRVTDATGKPIAHARKPV